MAISTQWKFFLFLLAVFSVTLGFCFFWPSDSGLWTHLDEALMKIEDKYRNKDNEIKFTLDPASDTDDWSLDSSKQIRVYMKTSENPIYGNNADQVLEKLRQWNGGKDFTWECTIYFNKPGGASKRISEEDKKMLERFFRQIQQTTNNPEAKPSVSWNKQRMISECAQTRQKENKRIRKEKKLDSGTLNAVLVFNLKEKDGRLVFVNRKLFEDVFCFVETRTSYWSRKPPERKVEC